MCKRFADIINSFRLARCVLALLISMSVLFGGPSVLLAQTKEKCQNHEERLEQGGEVGMDGNLQRTNREFR